MIPNSSYRPDVDGLRAVAVLAVVGFHYFPDLMPGGFIGVDAFFVISGYLITNIIIRDLAADSFSLSSFYGRRIRRIFPAMLLVIVASLSFGWFFLLPKALADLGRHASATSIFANNFLLWSETGYFDAPSGAKPLLHLWSLAIEEQFYLAWPTALVLLARKPNRVWAALLILLSSSLSVSVWLTGAYPTAAFYLPVTRAFELVFGALLAYLPGTRAGLLPDVAPSKHLSNALTVAGLATIITAIFQFSSRTPFPGAAMLVPCFGTGLVLVSGDSASINRSLLRHPAMVRVGLLSYPLYLWHWPLLTFPLLVSERPLSVTTRLALISLAFLLAGLTERFIERPIRFGPLGRRSVPFLLAMMAVSGALGWTMYKLQGVPSRFPQNIASVLKYEFYDPAAGARARGNVICWIGSDPNASFSPLCSAGRHGQLKDIALWGDSHAGRLYPGIINVYGRTDDVAQFTRDSCPPVLDFSYPACVMTNAVVLGLLRKHPPRVLLMFAVWDNYVLGSSAEAALLDALARTLGQLKSAGVGRIVVIGPAPHWQEALPRLLYRRWAENPSLPSLPDRLVDGLDQRTKAHDGRLRPLVEEAGATYVSLLEMMCDANGCLTRPPDVPDALMTWDYGHLTTPGAEFVAERLRPEIVKP